MATIITGINRFLRMLLAFVVMTGFMGLSTLHVLTLPQETPRATMIRLVGIDIAPQATHATLASHKTEHAAHLSQETAVLQQSHDMSHQDQHKHDGMHCPLCPLFAVSILGAILAALVLILPWVTTSVRRTPYVARVFAKGGFHFLPPVRGPPAFCPV